MKGYQIEFDDGSRMLIDANSEEEARAFATQQAQYGTAIVSIECLDD